MARITKKWRENGEKDKKVARKWHEKNRTINKPGGAIDPKMVRKWCEKNKPKKALFSQIKQILATFKQKSKPSQSNKKATALS